MTRSWWVFLAFVFAPLSARADVVTKSVEYKHGATTLEGVLVFDSAVTGKRPGVLVAHELGANSTIARTKAGQLARLGYVAFSVGSTAGDRGEAASA